MVYVHYILSVASNVEDSLILLIKVLITETVLCPSCPLLLEDQIAWGFCCFLRLSKKKQKAKER